VVQTADRDEDGRNPARGRPCLVGKGWGKGLCSPRVPFWGLDALQRAPVVVLGGAVDLPPPLLLLRRGGCRDLATSVSGAFSGAVARWRKAQAGKRWPGIGSLSWRTTMVAGGSIACMWGRMPNSFARVWIKGGRTGRAFKARLAGAVSWVACMLGGQGSRRRLARGACTCHGRAAHPSSGRCLGPNTGCTNSQYGVAEESYTGESRGQHVAARSRCARDDVARLQFYFI
jgi:hypothetical protein